MLTLGWIGSGMFVGAVDIPLTHRMAVSLISMALRTVRLLLVYRTSGEANALTILMVNTIFYFVGFVGAVVLHLLPVGHGGVQADELRRQRQSGFRMRVMHH